MEFPVLCFLIAVLATLSTAGKTKRCRKLKETDLMGISYTEDRNIGSFANFHCFAPGYRSGVPRTQCQENGEWADTIPTCQKECLVQWIPNGRLKWQKVGQLEWDWSTLRHVKKPTFEDVPNGTISFRELSLFIFCNSGYYVQGTGMRYVPINCSEGKWSPDPICVPDPSIRCTKFESKEKFIITYDLETRVGSQATISCRNPGQILNGTNVLTCLTNGEWSRNVPKCIDRKCRKWRERDQMVISYTNDRKIGSFAYFHCSAPGYRSGITWTRCLENGKWANKIPTCQNPNISCSKFEDEEEFIIIYDLDTRVGSQATFSCRKPDQILNGINVLTCLNTGKWSRDVPECIDRKCSELRENDLMTISYTQELKIGSFANFHCSAPGYRPEIARTQCLENGTWANSIPTCQKECTVQWIPYGRIREQKIGQGAWDWRFFRYTKKVTLENVPYGTITSRGMLLYLFCNSGYNFQGTGLQSISVQCSEGRWSPDPICILNGRKYDPSTKSVQVNSEIQRNSDSLPSTTSQPSILVTAASRLNDTRTQILSEEEIEIKVEATINPKPTEEAISETVCSCAYRIKDENVVAFTEGIELKHYDRVKDGVVVHFRCKHVGLQNLVGKKQMTCENCQTWHLSEYPICSNPKSGDAVIIYDKNVSISPDGALEVRKGQNVRLTCVAMEKAEFPEWKFPSGRGIIVVNETMERSVGDVLYMSYLQINNPDLENVGFYECAVGKNNPTVVEFRVIEECYVEWIPNAKIKQQKIGPHQWVWGSMRYVNQVTFEDIPYGTTARRGMDLFLFCNSGYNFQATGLQRVSINCSEGRWSPVPVCVLNGIKYVPSTEAVRISSEINGNIDTTTSQPSILRTANPSQKLQTTSILSEAEIEIKMETTLNSISAEETEENVCFCEYKLKDENMVAYTEGREIKFYDKVKDGSVLNFRCKDVGLHKLVGKKQMKCENCHTWHSSEFPMCENPVSGDAVIIYDKNISISLDGALEVRKGRNIRLTCVAMEEAIFPEWKFPSERGTSVAYDTLKRSVGDVLYMSHLGISNPELENDGLYECAVGTNRPTVVEIRVIDPNMRCSKFKDEENFIVTYNRDSHVGSQATFSCRMPGQMLNGTKVLTCLRNGEWSSNAPKCIERRCRKLDETGLMVVSYTNDCKIGSYANFHCFSPGIRSGVSRTQCLENGKWANEIPTCKEPLCSSVSLLSALPQDAEVNMQDLTHDTLPYNSTVRLMCIGDLIIVGNPVAKCINDGKWEVDNVQCYSGCLPFTEPLEFQLIMKPLKESYSFGESLEFSCPPGFHLSEDLQRIVCLRTGWSEKILPTCLDSNKFDSDYA